MKTVRGTGAMNRRDTTRQGKGLAGGWLQDFCANRKGAAAVEFVLIAPLLFLFYFATMEVSQGMDMNKKVSRVGSMVSDLVGQQGREVYTEDLDAIMRIGEAILKPYARSPISITITGIDIDKNANAKVKWSRKMVDSKFSRDQVKGAVTTVPEDLAIPETFLLRITAKLDYRPIITWTADQRMALGLSRMFDNIKMEEAYNLRPRMTTEIDCNNC